MKLIYLLLEELDIPRETEDESAEAEEQGNLVTSREHDQAWNAVIDLLDQFVEILGDEKISISNLLRSLIQVLRR